LGIPKIGQIFQPEVIGIFSELFSNLKSIIIIFFGPFIICLPDIIVKQITFQFFPNPSEYLFKFQKDDEYKKILLNDNISTNRLGKILVKKISKKFTKGYINESRKRDSNPNNSFKIINTLKDDLNNNTKYPLNDSNYDVSKNDNNILDHLNNESNNKSNSRRNKKNLKSNTNIKLNDLYSDTIFQDYINDKNNKHPNEVLHSFKNKRKINQSNISESSSMFNSSKSNYENNEKVKVIEEEQNNNSSVLGRQEKINLL
jgi:hypothetical protein